MPENPEVLPAVSELLTYELEPFTAVKEDTTDKDTTVSDLSIINNHLAICSAVLPQVKTLAALCVLSSTVCNLIKTRRGVKKLPFGEPAGGKNNGRTFEVIE